MIVELVNQVKVEIIVYIRLVLRLSSGLDFVVKNILRGLPLLLVS